MSAIATKPILMLKFLKGTNTKILDTRKTTPGFRALEKWAVALEEESIIDLHCTI